MREGVRARRWDSHRRGGWEPGSGFNVQQRGLLQESGAHFITGLEAFFRILSQSFADNCVNAAWKKRIDDRWRHRIFVNDFVKDGSDIATEGFFVRHKFVKNRPKGK